MTLLRNLTDCIPRFRWRRYLLDYLGVICFIVSYAELGLCGSLATKGGTPGSPEVFPPGRYPVESYVIHIGDVLSVKIFGCPELYQWQQVRPDGNISTLLIGDVRAGGLTPAELDTVLTKAYSQKIVDPEVAVIMRSFADQTVFVGGQVRRPGEIPLKDKLTALQAIFHAGGHTPEARLDSVILIRIFGKDEPEIMKLDVSRTVRTGKGETVLRPYDILFVPQSTIAKVDRFVEQNVHNIIPEAFRARLRYFINMNPERNSKIYEFLP